MATIYLGDTNKFYMKIFQICLVGLRGYFLHYMFSGVQVAMRRPADVAARFLVFLRHISG